MRTLDHEKILRVHGMYEVAFNGVRGLGMIMDFKAGTDLSKSKILTNKMSSLKMTK